MLFSNVNGVDFKGYFQGQKGPIWTFVIYLGQYLKNGAYDVANVCMKHIYKVIYDLSVDGALRKVGSTLPCPGCHD